jgi:ribosomal protein L37AE/L43A
MSKPLVVSLKQMSGAISRDVPCCPECNKSGIHKRTRVKVWTCENCGWSGKNPSKKSSTYVVKLPKALKARIAQETEQKNTGEAEA